MVGLQALNGRLMMEYAPLLIQLLVFCNLTIGGRRADAEEELVKTKSVESESKSDGNVGLQKDLNSESERSVRLEEEVSPADDEDFRSEPSEEANWEVVDIDPVEWMII
jgi:hypothetical protein